MRTLVQLAAIALAITSVDLASAEPCPVQFAHAAKAARFRSSLVQSFIPCGYDFFNSNTPNTTTETGTIPSCYPAATWHEQSGSPNFGWRWGPRSHGSIELKAGKNALVGPDYPLNDDPEAVDLYLRVKLSDVRSPEGLADQPGSIGIVLRITLIDREGGLMTIVDFPFGAALPIQDGKVFMKTSLSAMLEGISQPALPRCTSAEVLSVRIQDPNGNTFAVMGTYLP